MARRRKAKRFCFDRLTPDERAALLKAACAPRLIGPRAARAETPAEFAALLHPARWRGRPAPFAR